LWLREPGAPAVPRPWARPARRSLGSVRGRARRGQRRLRGLRSLARSRELKALRARAERAIRITLIARRLTLLHARATARKRRGSNLEAWAMVAPNGKTKGNDHGQSRDHDEPQGRK